MSDRRPSELSEETVFPKLPVWARADRASPIEDASHATGASLAVLDQILVRRDLPPALLRERLALTAATASLAFTGRADRPSQLRDEVLLLRPGDRPGPAGAIYLRWQDAVKQPLTPKKVKTLFTEFNADQVQHWFTVGTGSPVTRAAATLEAVLDKFPRREIDALMLADIALAKALGWDRVVPLLAVGVRPCDLHTTGEGLRHACYRAVIQSAAEAISLAGDLTRRVRRLDEVAPKLRAKAAGPALQLFRTRDALTPMALTGLMSDRAARRFCDRLVDLGAVRELTGRDSFRIYGV